MYLILCISLMLTFSYKLVDVIIMKILLKRIEKYTVLVWSIIIVITLPLFNKGYIFSVPINYEKAIPIFGVLILVQIISARFSGYNPKGKYNITNFIITYPIIEEVIFRGLILPNVKDFFVTTEVIQIFYMPVTIPVIVSAVLFSISHLQYYKRLAQCIRFMIFAFLGGIILGVMTEMTQSIIFAIILHSIFNFFSVIFTKKISKQ